MGLLKGVWLIWYSLLTGAGLFLVWVNFYVFCLHHMFIARGPRPLIYLWFLLWPMVSAIGVTGLVKHIRRAVDSN